MSVWEVAEIALVRVDHLSEVNWVDRYLKLELFSESSVEINQLLRWNSKGVPVFKSIKLLFQQTLDLLWNVEVRHFSRNLLPSFSKVVLPSFELFLSDLLSSLVGLFLPESGPERNNFLHQLLMELMRIISGFSGLLSVLHHKR